MSKQKKANIGLLIMTIGWGTSFILTKAALNELEVFNFLSFRFLIGAIVSGLIFYKNILKLDKKTMLYGMGVGSLLFSHYIFQTIGLNYTTASKSAFITGTSVVMVPVIAGILNRKFPEMKVMLGAFMALFGLAMMTLNGDAGVNIGDALSFVGAIIFALYIIVVGKYTKQVESIGFALVQIFTVGVLSVLTSLVFETPKMPTTGGTIIGIIILGVVCTSGAFIVQNIAQKYTTASSTALIYATEPVFAAIFAYLFVGEILSKVGMLGGLLILLGMLVAETDFIDNFKEALELRFS